MLLASFAEYVPGRVRTGDLSVSAKENVSDAFRHLTAERSTD